MIKSIFGWIHLSDLHFGHGDVTYQSEQKLVLHTLTGDVKKQVREIRKSLGFSDWNPNAIIISGDVAFSADVRSSCEYSEARNWLLDLAKEVGIDKTNILMVPGNHDVERLNKREQPDAYRLLKALRAGEETIDDVLLSEHDRPRLLSRIKAFLQFAGQINPLHACLGSEQHSFCWNKEFVGSSIPNIRIRTLGFNTALLCNDENDIKRLAIGTRALVAAINERSLGGTEVVMAVTHHPFDWLRDEESARRWIASHAQIHLCGHIHDQKAESYRAGGADPFLRIVAGASHNDVTSPGIGSHGYNIGLLLCSDNALVTRVWPRLWVDTQKDFRIDITNAVDGLQYVEHALGVTISDLSGLASATSTFDDLNFATSSTTSATTDVSVITNLLPKQIDEIHIPGTEFYSSFLPGSNRLCRIQVTTTPGFVVRAEQDSLATAKGIGEKYVQVENSVYVIRDPIRPFEIQIGVRRAARPGGDPGIVPHVAGPTAESLHLMYPILVDEPLKWLRMIFADLSTNPEVLNEIYHKDPDRTVRQMAARNPSASDALKATECLFCDREFLGVRMKRFENSTVVRRYKNVANMICNDYPYGPCFHYIVMPAAPIHSWQDISERHLLDMNLLILGLFP